MSEKDLKLTDLDYATGSHRLQMMKAALPYMNLQAQKMFSFFIRMSEMRRTMDFFRENEDGMLSICSINETQTSPLDMIAALKPFANSREQEMMDMITRMLQAQNNAMSSGGAQGPFPTPEQFISMLPPDQQARFETMQMMMQTLSQM